MRGLHGGLDLLAVADNAGRTVLRRQSFSPPIHISKPHHDEGWLVVNLTSPTPGLFAGDRVAVRVEVGVRVTVGMAVLLAVGLTVGDKVAEGGRGVRVAVMVAVGAVRVTWNWPETSQREPTKICTS